VGGVGDGVQRCCGVCVGGTRVGGACVVVCACGNFVLRCLLAKVLVI